MPAGAAQVTSNRLIQGISMILEKLTAAFKLDLRMPCYNAIAAGERTCEYHRGIVQRKRKSGYFQGGERL